MNFKDFFNSYKNFYHTYNKNEQTQLDSVWLKKYRIKLTNKFKSKEVKKP